MKKRLYRVFGAALALSSIAAVPAQAVQFPENLPTYRACEAKDISGILKVRKVFEYPVGKYSEEFSKNPHRYLYFKDNGSYAEIIRPKPYRNMKVIEQSLEAASTEKLQQYQLVEGLLYLYVDGVATDAYYCYVSLEKKGGVNSGDRLLQKSVEGMNAQIMNVIATHKLGKRRRVKRKKPAVEAAPPAQVNPFKTDLTFSGQNNIKEDTARKAGKKKVLKKVKKKIRKRILVKRPRTSNKK